MNMKRILSLITALTVFAGSAFADEGMWMLPLLQKMNSKALKDAGCELTPKQIYDINGSSLKDAIVQFGGGCTGEIISPEGLLVTNHHCGYGSIQKLSSVEHDYLKDGYWAMNRSEELPCEGLTVTFLVSMEDITATLEKTRAKELKKYKGEADAESKADDAVAMKTVNLVIEAEKANPHCEAVVTSFYNNNVSYLIVYKKYKDIRFVGAPPSSIGKFGADTDNWMWPRHTGDFSMFRVYSAPDGSPAEYSPENVPLKAKNHLKISLAGVQEGDYTMIMGYPGRTTRFQTSPELKNQIAINDIRIAARTVRQNVLLEDMLADPKVKIQYASKYSGSSNGWKKWQGMKLAFDKLDIIGRAEQEEADFEEWVNANKKRQQKYSGVLSDLATAAATGFEENCIYTYANESLARIELITAGAMANSYLQADLEESSDTSAALDIMRRKMEAFYKDYSVSTDRKVAKAMIKFYRDNVESTYYPAIKGFAEMDIDTYVDGLFDSSIFSTPERLAAASVQQIRKDPAISLLTTIRKTIAELTPAIKAGNSLSADARKTYTAGLMEWKKGEPSYPDANFTMRLTYGKAGGYSPKDAVTYRYYTTLDGVMEKEDPDNWEFVVPAKLKELWKNKDFGRYANGNGELVTCFLSNNDITGGNSGSPIMNSRGELIGLAFDGNWESMSSDVMFEPELQRCINVDIRYVLFIVDKFGGAGYLIDEMTIVD
jgi:hypothetical protein